MRTMSVVPTLVLLMASLWGTANAEIPNRPRHGEPPVSLSRTVAHPGDVIEVSGNAGPETLNWVASEAFVRRHNDPYPGRGGSAAMTVDKAGNFHGTARVADVPPGSYPVSVRIGGGNAGSVPLTVTAP